MVKKNPAAVALGALGGKRNSKEQIAARLRNAKLGGRRPYYQVVQSPLTNGVRRLELHVRDAATGSFQEIAGLDSAALIYLGRWCYSHVPGWSVISIVGGVMELAKLKKGKGSKAV